MTATVAPPARDVRPDPAVGGVSGRRIALRIGAVVGGTVLFLLFVWPALMLAIGAFQSGSPGSFAGWSTTSFRETLSSPYTWRVTGNSIVLGLLTSSLGVAGGGFLAWVAVRTTAPLRHLMTPLMVTSLFLPGLFYGLGWVMLTSGPTGTLNKWFGQVTGSSATPFETASWPGLVFIMVAFSIPIAYVLTIGPMSRLDTSLDDAARVAGASPLTTFRSVTVALMGPSLAGVFVIHTTYIFSSFDLPLLFGAPARIPVFSTAIFSSLTRSSANPDYAAASTLSLILIALTLLLVLGRRALLRGRNFTTVTGKGFRPEPRDYGRIQVLFTVLALTVVALRLVLPFAQMLLGSFQAYFGGDVYTLDNYARVLSNDQTIGAIRTTVAIAVVAGLLAASLALVLAYVSLHSRSWVQAFLNFITWTPIAIPGVVFGLALTSAYLAIPGLRSLYGTIWLLIIGFVVSVLPIAARTVEPALRQLGRELEDASRVSGAGTVRTFLDIVARISLPAFFAGWFLAGLVVSGDLSLPILLSNASLQTVPVQAYNLYATGSTSEAAALFVVMLLVYVLIGALLLVPVLLVRRARRARLAAVPQPAPAPVRDLQTVGAHR